MSIMKKAGRIVWVMILSTLVSFAVCAQQKDTKKQPKHNAKDSTDRVYGGSVKQNVREKDTNDKNWKPHNPAEITPDRSSNIADRKARNTSRQAQDSARSIDVLGTDTGTPARNKPLGNQELQPDGTNTVQRATYNIAGAAEPGQKRNVSDRKDAEQNQSTNTSVMEDEGKAADKGVDNDSQRKKEKRDKKKSRKRKD